MTTLTIHETRGGIVESIHPIHAVLVDGDGRVIERLGEPMSMTWRSAAKPFQLAGSLSALPDGVELANEDLALGAASHHGQEAHIRRVRHLLRQFRCTEGHLLCGAHWPLNQQAEHGLARVSQAPDSIHNNCSGKHAFMAGASRAQGWDADYRRPDHPLQRRILELVQRVAQSDVTSVVDGCGVPCFVLPLDNMARAYANLAGAMQGDSRLGEIGRAMASDPWWVGGTGSVDTRIMLGGRRQVVAKVGAQALLCLAFADRGLGMVIKVMSGNNAARAVATAALLERWVPGAVDVGVLAEDALIDNWVGRRVGKRIAVFS